MKTFMCLLILVGLMASPCLSDKKFETLIAKKAYEKALKYIDTEYRGERDADIIYNIGYANEQLGNTEKAIASYITVDRMKPNNCLILSSIARVYCKMKLCERAYSYSAMVMLIDSTTEEYKELHADICYQAGKIDEAQKLFETLSYSEQAKNALSNIYFNKKLYKKAIPYLINRFSSQKEDSIALKLYYSYTTLNKLDSSLYYLKFIKTMSVDDRLKLARLYGQTEQCEQAVLEYSKLPMQLFDETDFYNQGLCCEKQNNVRALAFYESALKKSSDAKLIQDLKMKITKIYLDTKNYSGALKYIRELELQKPNLEFDKIAAKYYHETNNYERASYYASRVLKVDSINVSMFFVIINAFEKQGMITKANNMTEKLSKLQDNPKNILYLAEYYYQNNNYVKALEFFEKSYINLEEVSLLEKVAICAYVLKDYDKAKDASETLLRKKVESSECRKILYKIALNKKKYQLAISHLEALVLKEQKLEYFNDLALCYKETNKTDKLLDIDSKIIELDKKNIESRERLASFCVTQNKNSQALWLYYEVEQLRKFDTFDYLKIVSLLEKTNDDSNCVLYLRKIISVDPSNVESHKKLGDIFFKQKKHDDAFVEYNKVLSLDGSRTDYLKNFCYVVIAKKNQQEIIKVGSKAFSLNQTDVFILVNLADTYFSLSEFSKALEVFSKIPQDKIDVNVLLKIAICQERLNLTSAAILSYEQYTNICQTAKTEFLSLAKLYSRINKDDQVISTYKAYLRKYKDETLSKEVAKYEYEHSNYVESIKYFSETNVSREPELMFMFGHSMFMSKQYDDAISILSSCEKFSGFSKMKDVYNLIAISHENLKNIEKAIKYYRLYSQFGTNDSTISFHTAELQEQLHISLAKDLYEENTKKFINDSRNFLRLGEIYYKFNDFKKAKFAFEKVKSLQDNVSIDVLLKLSHCYRETNDRTNEIKTYKEVLTKDNKNFTANKYLGIYCYEAGEVREGLEYLELAKTQNYNDPDMLYILGRIYLKDGFSNEGFMFLQSSKKQKPKDTKIRLYIIEAYQRFGKQKEACDEIEELLKIDRSSSNLELYSKALFESKNFQTAETIAIEMRKKDPRNTKIMMFLAQVKIEQGLYDDALEYCKMISYVDSKHAASICKRADIYMLKKDVELAKEYYLKSLKVNPKHAMSYYGLAIVYKLSGDIKQYMDNISKAVELDSTSSVITEELKRSKQ